MWAEFYKIKMIDRYSGYVDPDEDFQLEEEEDQDILMKKSQSLKKMIQMLFKLVNHKQKNQQSPQLEWQMMSQWFKDKKPNCSRRTNCSKNKTSTWVGP